MSCQPSLAQPAAGEPVILIGSSGLQKPTWTPGRLAQEACQVVLLGPARMGDVARQGVPSSTGDRSWGCG